MVSPRRNSMMQSGTKGETLMSRFGKTGTSAVRSNRSGSGSGGRRSSALPAIASLGRQGGTSGNRQFRSGSTVTSSNLVSGIIGGRGGGLRSFSSSIQESGLRQPDPKLVFSARDSEGEKHFSPPPHPCIRVGPGTKE